MQACRNKDNKLKNKVMDYAIYKSVNGNKPHVIYTFTQEACNHRAKAAAREKLNDIWLRVIQRPERYHNARGASDEFSYNYMTSSNTSDLIRFYITNYKTKQ
jgi:protein-disulfide isomerase